MLAVAGLTIAGNLFIWRDKIFSKRKAKLLGPDFRSGHRLRSKNAPAKTATQKVETLIIGAGLSGLSAGWYLQKQGYHNFQIFDLEKTPGGNARSGEQKGLRYPWGAHYLPLPGRDAIYVKELLAEMAVYDKKRYTPEFVGTEPLERLFLYSRWQPGLFPRLGAADQDLREYERFKKLMAGYRRARGRDGRPAFTIPLELSSTDQAFRKLDKISMSQFMQQQGFGSNRLLWYVNYACLDDYGAKLDTVSAWAGVHYFAARAHENNILVWPEGLGFIANYLQSRLQTKIATSRLVYHIEKTGDGLKASFFDKNQQKSAIVCKRIIFAAPKFLLSHIMPGQQNPNLVYSPWLVANLHLKSLPDSIGPHFSWDNIIYGGKGLGYINARHQLFGEGPRHTVWTYYRAYGEPDVSRVRRELLSKAPKQAYKELLADLGRAHPDLGEFVTDAQFYYWAHAMIRPVPGFIWSKLRREMRQPLLDNRIFLAHSDASGISIFEEAQYQGIRAAKELLAAF